jgi:hypothetical protein
MEEQDQPVFDEVQVARILRRTAELQAGRPDEPVSGLSLIELQQLAAEAGLDPNLISAAVAEIEADRNSEGNSWWGGPTTWVTEQDVPFSVDDALWERMLVRIRSKLGGTGSVDVRGRTREWTHDAKDGYAAQVTVTTDGDRSHVRIFRSSPMAATLYYIFSSILAFIGFLVLVLETGPLVGIPIWIAGVAALFFAVRWLVSRSAEKDRRTTFSLMSELAAMGGRAKASETSEGQRTRTSDSPPRITLPEDEDIRADSDTMRPRSRTSE